MEENEEDLVYEIENLAKERQASEVENHEQKYENESLKMTIAELTRIRDTSDAELGLIRRKFEAAQEKNNELTT